MFSKQLDNMFLYQTPGETAGPPPEDDFQMAEESYQKAIENTDDSGPIMRKLLFVYIDKGDNQRAIDYSDELLDKYPNDADLYFNVGVLYQRLTLRMFDPTRELFLKTTDEDTSSPETIKGIYDSFVMLCYRLTPNSYSKKPYI